MLGVCVGRDVGFVWMLMSCVLSVDGERKGALPSDPFLAAAAGMNVCVFVCVRLRLSVRVLTYVTRRTSLLHPLPPLLTIPPLSPWHLPTAKPQERWIKLVRGELAKERRIEEFHQNSKACFTVSMCV